MGTIGSLIVKIGTDISSIQRDSKKGAQSLGALEGATNTLGTALKALAIGAAIKGLASMVSTQLKAVDASAKLSRQLGGTINGLQGLKLAASDAGLNAGTLTAGMEALNKKLGEAARLGSGPAHEALKRLGLDARELGAMDLDQRMAAIADAIDDTGMSTIQTADTLKELGVRQGQFTRLLLDGGDALRGARDEIDAMGLSLTEVEASKIEAANDAMERVQMASQGIARRLAVELSPILTVISNQFLDAASDTKSLTDGVKTVVEFGIKGFGFLGDSIRGVILVFKSVELAIAAVGAANAVVFIEIIKGVSKVVDVGIEKLNKLISVANLVGLTDIRPIGLTADSDVLKDLREFEAGMVATTEAIAGEIAELVTSEWPSDKAAKFFSDVQAQAQAAAEGVIEARREMQFAVGGGGGGGAEDKKAEEAEEKFRAQLQRRLETLRDAALSEEELENKKHARNLQLLNESLDAQHVSQSEFNSISQGLEKNHMEKLARIRKTGMQKVQEVSASAMAAGARTILGGLKALTAGAANENKAMFDLHKAFAISDAVISGAQGVAQTYGSLPFPVNIPFAVAHAGLAAAQVGIIASKQFGGGSKTVAVAPSFAAATGATAGGATAGGAGATAGGITGGGGTNTTVNLQGSNFGRGAVLGLIEELNEAIGDGARIEVG